MHNGLKIIDADAHVMEPDDLWLRYIEPRFRERAPRRAEGQGVWRPFLVDGQPMYRNYPPELVAKFEENIQRDYPDAHLSGFDAASQLRAMDATSIDVAFHYPSLGLGVLAIDGMDPDLAAACARAYNNWLVDFCSYAPDRLRPVGVVSLHRTSDAVEEVRRLARELKIRVLTIRPNPIRGRHLGDPDLKPFWAECERQGVSVSLHEGAHTRLPSAGSERFTTHFAMHTCCHPLEQMMAFVSLVDSGVLERHPELQVAFLESGCGWVPYWLWRMDELEYKHWRFQIPHVKKQPSEYFARQCWVSCEGSEPNLAEVIKVIGADRLLFASDYPHPDHAAGEELGEILEAPLPEDVKQRILWDNPCRFYGLT